MIPPERIRELFQGVTSGGRAALEDLAVALEANRLEEAALGVTTEPVITAYPAAATRPDGYPPDLPFVPHEDVKVLHHREVTEPTVHWFGVVDAPAVVDMIIAQSIDAGWEYVPGSTRSGMRLDQLECRGKHRLILWQPGTGGSIQMLHPPMNDTLGGRA